MFLLFEKEVDIQETKNLYIQTKLKQQMVMHARWFCSELYDKDVLFHNEHLQFSNI